MGGVFADVGEGREGGSGDLHVEYARIRGVLV